MIICDVWGGEFSQEHVARYVLDLDEALKLASAEISDGYLVNLRSEVTWGGYVNFDDRMGER